MRLHTPSVVRRTARLAVEPSGRSLQRPPQLASPAPPHPLPRARACAPSAAYPQGEQRRDDVRCLPHITSLPAPISIALGSVLAMSPTDQEGGLGASASGRQAGAAAPPSGDAAAVAAAPHMAVVVVEEVEEEDHATRGGEVALRGATATRANEPSPAPAAAGGGVRASGHDAAHHGGDDD